MRKDAHTLTPLACPHAVCRPYRKVAKKPKHAKYSRDDNSRCVYPFALWAYTGQ
jgi:hypothetical protein